MKSVILISVSDNRPFISFMVFSKVLKAISSLLFIKAKASFSNEICWFWISSNHDFKSRINKSYALEPLFRFSSAFFPWFHQISLIIYRFSHQFSDFWPLFPDFSHQYVEFHCLNVYFSFFWGISEVSNNSFESGYIKPWFYHVFFGYQAKFSIFCIFASFLKNLYSKCRFLDFRLKKSLIRLKNVSTYPEFSYFLSKPHQNSK